MKIVHVYKDFDPPVHGGMERHIAQTCRFQRAEADVEALTCSRSVFSRRVRRDGTLVTEVGEWGRFQSAPLSPLFPWYMRRIRADIVVVHVPNPTAEIGYLLGRPPAKLVVRYQSDVVRQAAAMRAYKPLLMKFLNRAAMIIPTSAQYLETSELLRPVRSKCRVVPLGIIPDEFESAIPERVAALREQYGAPYVLFSGVHRYYKGLEYLVRAAASIDAPVVISGDGPAHASVVKLARELNAPVRFPGRLSREDLVNHLHGCSVFVFPSVARSEAFGISILEAHACAKPVVATRLGTGVEYANLDGVTGVNVPARDPDALADAANRLLHDTRTARRMGETAQRRVREEFDARAVAARELELYRELL